MSLSPASSMDGPRRRVLRADLVDSDDETMKDDTSAATLSFCASSAEHDPVCHQAASSGCASSGSSARNIAFDRRPLWADIVDSDDDEIRVFDGPGAKVVSAGVRAVSCDRADSGSSTQDWSSEGGRLDDLADIDRQLEIGDAAVDADVAWELPSAGSAAHAAGTCKACAFHAMAQGCAAGATCRFCHLPHAAKTRAKRPSKGKRDMLRRAWENNIVQLQA